jgi:hypothetical protein
MPSPATRLFRGSAIQSVAAKEVEKNLFMMLPRRQLIPV